ncbi:MAG: MMPL family transporter [Planctomycetota bacterium]
MLDRWRHQLLGRWSRVVAYYPRRVLAIGLLLAVLGVVYSATHLRFQSNRNDLISPELGWNQRFIAWQDHFPGNADLLVVIDTHRTDGGPGGADVYEAGDVEGARRLADTLGEMLRGSPGVSDVSWRIDTSRVSGEAIRLLDGEAFDEAVDALAASGPVLASPTVVSLLDAASREAGAALRPGAGGGSPQETAEQVRGLATLFAAIDASLADPEPVELGNPFAETMDELMGLGGYQYFETPNGRLLFLRVTPKRQAGEAGIQPYDEAIQSVRSAIASVEQTHPGFDVGLTGIDVVEADETDAAERDSTRASIVAAVLIATLLVVAFWSFRTPAILMVSLLVAMAWAFGYLTLAIGHLQVISVVFAVILLGLGVDFGIHLLSRFERVRHDHPDGPEGFAATLQDTLEVAGPGVVTGALTTAAALSTTMLTDFSGVAEMGHIAAVGIVLCLLSMFTVLPALLRLLRHATGKVKPMASRRVHVYSERWSMAASRRPAVTLAVVVLLLVVAGFGVARVRYSFNLADLMPRGVDSVAWAERIERDGAQSIYFGVSVVGDMAEARALGEKYLALPTVEGLGGVGLAIPRNEAAKVERLTALGASLPAVDERRPGAVTAEDVASLRETLGRWGGLLTLASFAMPTEARPALVAAQASLGSATAQLDTDDEAVAIDRVAGLRADYQAWRAATVRRIEEAVAPEPMGLDALPEVLTRPYVATYGGERRLALEVFPRLTEGIESPLDPRFLGDFVSDLRLVDPEVTGVIVQVYESNALIVRSYAWAGVMALIAVAIILWIDFRRPDDALLSMLPTFLAFLLTLGVMGWLDDPIDPANIIVLPLLFGIGVDAGVHLMHRYRQEPSHRPLGLASGTGKGIALTSYTTIIGFGALMIASHRGIAGLGFVMSIGIAFTLLACCYVIPAILELRQRHLERLAASASSAAAGAEEVAE